MKYVTEAIGQAVRHRNLNCLITETFALAKAQAEDAGKRGVKPFPVIVKDCFAVKDVPMTCSSKMLVGYKVPYTATIVERLIDAGGCIIGKSNLDEFSMGSSSLRGFYGPVKSGFTADENVNDDWVIAGGSSGGSAVGVQLGMARIALGSDTGGSTRNPAAFNGVFGFKPTYGLLSRHGMVPLTNSLDTPSIMSRTIDDCKLFFDIMKGHDPYDATTVSRSRCLPRKNSLKGLVIGIPKEYFNEYLSPTVLRALNSSALRLEKAGCTIKEVSMKHTEQSIVCYHILGECDVASNMARYDGVSYGFRKNEETSSLDAMYTASRSESLNSIVKNRILAGNYFLLKENRKKFYDSAVRLRRLVAGDFKKVFSAGGDGIDALLTPVTSDTAQSYKSWKKEGFQRDWNDDFYTQPANMAGVPAISVPVGKCRRHRPVGVQLICNLFQDDLCMYIADELHRLMCVDQK